MKGRYITFNRQYGNKYSAAGVELNKLIEIYQNSKYPLFHEVADTLSYHFESIANSFIMVERLCCDGTHVSRLSNGPMESLNRIAKALKRNGHGYRNFDHMRNRFLFSQREYDYRELGGKANGDSGYVESPFCFIHTFLLNCYFIQSHVWIIS